MDHRPNKQMQSNNMRMRTYLVDNEVSGTLYLDQICTDYKQVAHVQLSQLPPIRAISTFL